jgi:bifunctional enzyme CysN/CysC
VAGTEADGADTTGTAGSGPGGGPAVAGERVTPGVVWHPGAVSREERAAVTGGEGAVIWFTGLSGSGKSSVAVEVEKALVARGRAAYLLDGDNLRHGLNGDLGFSAADRGENVRRVGEVAALFADAGVVAVVPLVSPYRADRDRVRRRVADAGLRFIEVFVDTPLKVCESRDPKGLYAKARAGELIGLTGVDDPYEPPSAPELVLRPSDGDPSAQAALVLQRLDAA